MPPCLACCRMILKAVLWIFRVLLSFCRNFLFQALFFFPSCCIRETAAQGMLSQTCFGRTLRSKALARAPDSYSSRSQSGRVKRLPCPPAARTAVVNLDVELQQTSQISLPISLLGRYGPEEVELELSWESKLGNSGVVEEELSMPCSFAISELLELVESLVLAQVYSLLRAELAIDHTCEILTRISTGQSEDSWTNGCCCYKLCCFHYGNLTCNEAKRKRAL